MRISLRIFSLILYLHCAAAQAMLPATLNYQSFLTDPSGTPIDGNVTITFSFYATDIGGTVLWTASAPVIVDHGLVSVELGGPGNPFPAGLFNTPLWIGVAVGADPEMTPRRPLTTVGFAFRADDALSLQGQPPSAFDQSVHVADLGNPHGITTGQIGAATSTDITNLQVQLDSALAAIATLQSEIAVLQSGLADETTNRTIADNAEAATRSAADTALNTAVLAIQANSVLALDGLLSLSGGNTALFNGVNLQIVNGTGTTDGTANGLGNIVVGYNTIDTDAAICSLGLFVDQLLCESNGAVWASSHKSGSHNVVIGDENNYSRFGGVVAGFDNNATGDWASISGGTANTAAGEFSSVSGGHGNLAVGESAAVSGGALSTASGIAAAVSGGQNNVASGPHSSASGGEDNTASWIGSSVVGGRDNTSSGIVATATGGTDNLAANVGASVTGGQFNSASGSGSSVHGGFNNTASGITASVVGGVLNEASGTDSSLLGGRRNIASGVESNVSGGKDNEAIGTASSILGGINNIASGVESSVSGGKDNEASGPNSSLLGGLNNIASGVESSVSGGKDNEASGLNASVTAGRMNIASGDYSSVVGGGTTNPANRNIAFADYSSVLGGERNQTGNGVNSVVGHYSTIVGGLRNRTTGYGATVGGGDDLNCSSAASECTEGIFTAPD